MLRSGTFDGSEAIELKQSLRTGFQDLREACILAEERSLANPRARGDCPDYHAVNESIHDVLGEKRTRDRETGKDAANLLRDLTIATLNQELAKERHQNLTIWKEAMVLVNDVYTTTKTFPKDEVWGRLWLRT